MFHVFVSDIRKVSVTSIKPEQPDPTDIAPLVLLAVKRVRVPLRQRQMHVHARGLDPERHRRLKRPKCARVDRHRAPHVRPAQRQQRYRMAMSIVSRSDD